MKIFNLTEKYPIFFNYYLYSLKIIYNIIIIFLFNVLMNLINIKIKEYINEILYCLNHTI